MIKHILIALSLISVIAFQSCVETPDVYEPVVINFYIQDRGNYDYSEIKFTLDTLTNTISNEELFPYGSLDDTLTGYFRYENANYMTVKYGGIDSFISTFYFDHLFKSDVFINLRSSVTGGDVEYKIDAKAVLENPNGVSWSAYRNLPADYNDGWYKKGYYFKGKDYVLTGNINTEKGEVSNSLYVVSNGVFSDELPMSNFPKGLMHTIVAFDGKLHIYGYLGLDEASNTYVAKQEHWVSEDGTNWTQSDVYPAIGEGIIFSQALVLKNELWFYGGSKINEGKKALELALYNVKPSSKNIAHSYQDLKNGKVDNDLLYGVLAITDTISLSDTVCQVKMLLKDGIPEASNTLLKSSDGFSFTNVGQIQEGVPVRFSAVTDYGNMFLSFGGEMSNAELSEDVWISEDMDYFLSEKSPTASITNGCVIYYRDILWGFGGEREPSSFMGALESGDISDWSNSPLERAFQSDNENAAGYSAWVNPETNFLYVIGSYQRSGILRDGVMYNERVSAPNASRGIFNSYLGAY